MGPVCNWRSGGNCRYSNLTCFIASPVRRGLTFFLDEKSKQKNQDAPNSLTAQTVERRLMHMADVIRFVAGV
jgi:hypothetical protein